MATLPSRARILIDLVRQAEVNQVSRDLLQGGIPTPLNPYHVLQGNMSLFGTHIITPKGVGKYTK